MRPFNSWALKVTGGDPKRFNAGYDLNGRPLEKDFNLAFLGPLAVAASTQPERSQWKEAVCRALLEEPPEDYYADTIKLMCLIVLGGYWR